MGKSGFTFEGSGRLDRIDTFVTKSNKEIVTLVLQVEGTYPQLVPIKFFGRLADEAKEASQGDVIEVTGHLGGRDWNGRVFGDIVGERLEVVSSGGARGAGQHREEHYAPPPSRRNPPDPDPSNGDDDIPF